MVVGIVALPLALAFAIASGVPPERGRHWRGCCFPRDEEDFAVPIKGKKESKQRAIKSPQTSGRTNRGGVGMLVTPTPELAHIIGSKPLSRGEAMKKLWDYIKQHNLQDPENKRMIRADANLRPVFDGNAQLSMFEMTAYVSRHLNRT